MTVRASCFPFTARTLDRPSGLFYSNHIVTRLGPYVVPGRGRGYRSVALSGCAIIVSCYHHRADSQPSWPDPMGLISVWSTVQALTLMSCNGHNDEKFGLRQIFGQPSAASPSLGVGEEDVAPVVDDSQVAAGWFRYTTPLITV